MDSLVIHALMGFSVYPFSLMYWYIYWYIQPSDPNSLKIGFDVVTGQRISRKARRLEFAGFIGAGLLVFVWAYLGNYYAKAPVMGTDLLAVFHFSDSSLYSYLYLWFCCVVGMVSLARHSAKALVSRKKWLDDERRRY